MLRVKFTVLTTLALTALLGTAVPVIAQRGGGAHGGTGGFHGGYDHGGYYHRGYGSYPYGFIGIDIGLGYGYGYGYGPGPYYYAPAVVGSPAPVVVIPPAPEVPAPSDGSERLPPPLPSDNVGCVTVLVPADAVLWFNGQATTLKGVERRFRTPELTPGKSYTYEVKARWMQEGRPVERTLQAVVRANKTTTVSIGVLPPPKN